MKTTSSKPEKKAFDGVFVVKVAGQVREVELGVTRFGNSVVVKRLEPTISSRGAIKALWRLQCDICSKTKDRDLSSGKRIHGCRCVERLEGEPRRRQQVLGVLAANSTSFMAFRKIKAGVSKGVFEADIEDEDALRAILQSLIEAGSVELARDAHSRGYRFVRKEKIESVLKVEVEPTPEPEPDNGYVPPTDHCDYGED